MTDLAGAPLTPIERRVIALIARGHRIAEIAEELVMSESTVRHHRGRIFEKLGVRSAAQAVAIWIGQRAMEQAIGRSVLTVSEAAAALGVHVNTVKRIKPSRLPYFRVTSRGDRRYRAVDVTRYIEENLVK
jgi:DNA-binding CsgD family transcriptional regulator